MTVTLPDAASPLYARVKALILRNIGDGTWPRDRRLPSEHDLVALTGTSRMTVHRAVRELTSEGVLHRVQGVGTFVATPVARSGLIEIEDIAREIRRRGAVHGSRVRGRAPDYGAQDFSARTPFDYLIEVAPLTEFEHVISAVAASAEIAAALAVELNSPCLLLHRRTWSGARVATVNRLTYAGNCSLATRRKVGAP